MSTRPMNTVIQQLRRTVLAGDDAAMTDGQLLDCFVASKNEGAFETLLRRHGPMVLGVCRRVLRNHHDAEDAFQATFLVLARKASSVKPSLMVGNWLHGVAYRTALKANEMSQKRKTREKHCAAAEVAAAPKSTWDDLQPLIDEELNRLPDRYRLPIVLCDLEGKSIKEATRQLGWPQGTLAGRLARARKLLARRLAQRGIALFGGALAMAISANSAVAGVQPTLAAATIAAAVALTKSQTVSSIVISAKAAALMEGVMKAMMLTKLKAFASMALLLSTLAFGSGLAIHHTAAAQQSNAPGDLVQAAPRVGEPSSVADDVKALQGAWKFVGFERGGAFRTEEEIKKLQLFTPFVQITFTPKECIWYLRPEGSEVTAVKKMAYALHATAGAKWIEFKPQGETNDRGFKCPYSFQGKRGNELRIEFPHQLTGDGRLFSFHYFQKETPGDKKASDRAPDEKKLDGEWVGKDPKMGTISVTFGPDRFIRIISEHQDPDDSQRQGTYAVDLNKSPYHLDVQWKKGARTETIFEFDAKGRLRIEAGGDFDDGRPKTFSDESIWLTRFDKLKGMRDLEFAQFYRRAGKLGSAYFYYELTRVRYPGTEHAKKAVEGLEELKKHLIVRADGSVGFDQGIDLKEDRQPPPTLIPFTPPQAERLLEQALGKQSDVARLSIKIQSPTMFIASNSFVIEKDGRVRMEPFRALQYGPDRGSQVTLISSDRAVISFSRPIEKVADFGNATVVGLQFHGVTEMRNIDIKRQEATPPPKKADAKQVHRVGEIFVVGNQKTPTTEILKLVPIYPGEVLDYPKLRTAEKNLAAFKATVAVIESSSGEFRDILITIKE